MGHCLPFESAKIHGRNNRHEDGWERAAKLMMEKVPQSHLMPPSDMNTLLELYQEGGHDILTTMVQTLSTASMLKVKLSIHHMWFSTLAPLWIFPFFYTCDSPRPA